MDNSFSVLARFETPVDIIDLFSELYIGIKLVLQSNLIINELTVFFYITIKFEVNENFQDVK